MKLKSGSGVKKEIARGGGGTKRVQTTAAGEESTYGISAPELSLVLLPKDILTEFVRSRDGMKG